MAISEFQDGFNLPKISNKSSYPTKPKNSGLRFISIWKRRVSASWRKLHSGLRRMFCAFRAFSPCLTRKP